MLLVVASQLLLFSRLCIVHELTCTVSMSILQLWCPSLQSNREPLLGAEVVDANGAPISPIRKTKSVHTDSDSDFGDISHEFSGKKASIYCVMTIVLIDNLNFAVILPSLSEYLKSLGYGTDILGLVVGLYYFAQLLAAPVFGYLSDKNSFKTVIVFGLVLELAAWTLYAVWPSITAIFISRCLAGIAAGNLATCQLYISKTTSESERTQYMAMFSGAIVLGFVIGTGVGGLATLMDFYIGSHHVNQYNAAAHCCIIMVLLNAFQVATTLVEIPEHIKHEATIVEGPTTTDIEGPEITQHIPSSSEQNWVVPATVLIYLFFVLMTIWSVFETIHTPFVQDSFQWSTGEVGIAWAVSGVVAVIVNAGLSILSTKVSDLTLLCLGWTQGMAGFLFLSDYSSPPISIPMYVTGHFFAVSGFSFMECVLVSAFSKILPAHVNQGRLIGYYNSGGSIAQIVGPLWSSQLYENYGADYVWMPTAGLAVSGLMLSIAFRNRIFKVKEETTMYSTFDFTGRDALN